MSPALDASYAGKPAPRLQTGDRPDEDDRATFARARGSASRAIRKCAAQVHRERSCPSPRPCWPARRRARCRRSARRRRSPPSAASATSATHPVLGRDVADDDGRGATFAFDPGRGLLGGGAVPVGAHHRGTFAPGGHRDRPAVADGRVGLVRALGPGPDDEDAPTVESHAAHGTRTVAVRPRWRDDAGRRAADDHSRTVRPRRPIRSMPRPRPRGLRTTRRRLERRTVSRSGCSDSSTRASGAAGCADALTGRWLGHAVHPVLTDLPIGFWTSAFTLDLIGGRRSRAAAQRLVGTRRALGAAHGGERRGGLVRHDGRGTARRVSCTPRSTPPRSCASPRRGWRVAAAATAAASCYGLAGSTVATGGGYFGGHLVQRCGLGVDHTTFDERPDASGRPPARRPSGPTLHRVASTPAARGRGRPGRRRLVRTRRPVLARRRTARRGHGERRLHRVPVAREPVPARATASVARGPAFAPQPVVAVRVRDDIVEVKAAPAIGP